MSTRKRAPNGYRITQWIDGSYHVDGPNGCIAEVLDRDEAVEIARADKSRLDAEYMADALNAVRETWTFWSLTHVD